MGRFLLITCRENITAGEKEDEYVITQDGGLKYYESRAAAFKAMLRQRSAWARQARASVRPIFTGIYDVKKGCWL